MKQKLRVVWRKGEVDLKCYYPTSKADAAFIFFDVFTKEFRREMEQRGYDITTLKFEISKRIEP